MEILNKEQFNQGVSKYKVLSSNAGVGSIVATKWGGFVMPVTVSDWRFIQVITDYLDKNSEAEIDYNFFIEQKGVELIEDERFVKFLRETEGLKKLSCLVAIPHVVLNQYNYCNVKEHPINIRYKEKHKESQKDLDERMFTIPAIIFPRWFYSRSNSHDFKPLEEWLEIWKREGCNKGKEEFFAPPRDPYLKTKRSIKGKNLPDDKSQVHALLEQVSMVLICPNGHISDIPWYKYFCAKLNNETHLHEKGFDLFNYDESSSKCPNHKHHELQWLENRNNAESFGTLKCKNCGQSISLEGIMNLCPCCPGHRPWEGEDAKDIKACEQNGTRCSMKWAMVASNSVYYAENFSSLFIPECYLGRTKLSKPQKEVLKLIREKWYPKYKVSHPTITEQEYVKEMGIKRLIEKADDSDKTLDEKEMQQIIGCFIPHYNQSEIEDLREYYRFQEYSVFQNNAKSSDDSDKLIFHDIDMAEELKPYFSKIQQVNTLGLSSTQINFSRVEIPQPKIVDGVIKYPNSMKIFKGNNENVRVMPANQTFGEGLFFSFNEQAIENWLKLNKDNDEFLKRNKIGLKDTKSKQDHLHDALKQKMERGGSAKFYLLHTFSHILMKELEFSCGYPTASLCERLYFSNRMCGVLIYTADGSEGSMGGLVWQGQPPLIKKIIKSALRHAMDCASDPICWENGDDINYAACFSCAMVSETSCEERNLGLDRRALVDQEFGFFKDLLKL